MSSFVQLAATCHIHRRAGKQADEATRLVVRPREKGRSRCSREEKNEEDKRREESIYRILQVRFLILLPGRGPPLPEGAAPVRLLRLLRPARLAGCSADQPCSSIEIAASTAFAKTSSTPRISLLLHSAYVAPIRRATFSPCSGVMGVRPWVLRSSMQVRLLRRSDLSPTRIIGVVGQKCRTSGYHYIDLLEECSQGISGFRAGDSPCQQRSPMKQDNR
jgi:hypothetical protein